jgi:hypothetical protein
MEHAMDTNEQDARYKQAKERVEEVKGFYAHLAVYAIVNAGLFLINLAAGGGHWWFYWPLVGWGVGLAIHAVMVFAIEGPRGRAWEERKIRELMEHDRGAGQA